MTESNPMLQEMIRVHNNLSITATRTHDKFDARMRATVKDMLSSRYAIEVEPIEVTHKREYLQTLKNADIFTDRIFGVDSSKRRQGIDNYEWNRGRPLRIYNYVQKLANIFPADDLNILLRCSLNHTAVEIISLFEAIKGEALQSDYSGQPTAIDLTAFKTTE